MKRDGYGFIQKWEIWKTSNLNKPPKGVRKEDYKIFIEYLKDMELGLNTPAARKGKRSAGTLLNLSSHLLFFLKVFKKPLVKLTKEDVAKLERDIDSGKILKKNGKKFGAFGNYIKDLKAFWGWMIRTGKAKENILIFSSSKTDKPSWVYLTEEQAKNFFNNLIPYYRMISWFMYDTGSRVTEANSIQIKHFSKDFKQVTIPDEAAKTFGRTINLKLCSDLIKEYVQLNNLKEEDYLFQRDLFAMNKYLKTNCGKKFGKDKISDPKAKGKYGTFTLYDIRHNSACFWLNRYPTHSALMYRMGWKNADKVDYYTGFLGQADKLTDADMVSAQDKPKIYELEKNLEKQKSISESQKKDLSELKNQTSLVLRRIINGDSKIKESLKYFEIEDNFDLNKKAKPITKEEFSKIE
jgi:integrase